MAYVTPWLSEEATGIVQVYDETNKQWVSLIDPSAMEYQLYDIDSGETTGRNLAGNLIRERVAIKEKIVMSFPPMQAQDFTTMLSLIANQSFQCKYYSLRTGTVRTATMYVGDRTANRYNKLKNETEAQIMWTDIKFNFIEF